MTRQFGTASPKPSRRFRDRREAGVALAQRLGTFRPENPVVLALPRGGVPVAYEVARALGAPLDVMVVRKLGVPFQPELGMGAIGEGGVRVLDPYTVRVAQVTADEIAAVEGARACRAGAAGALVPWQPADDVARRSDGDHRR